ncbi:MAG: glycosyltransferase [Patescibacteria group bacterium]|nr:glycosyltransferase [Patescibacteria group bacterium]MDD5121293.1 glycosyltransferase [Patescibacteria group bacterium]MDD5221723.1 glycosyltransferase [Patescibacteria group bacterium]MDD5395788.1 glycosyltransferase [Patescibacteria group bacterium]
MQKINKKITLLLSYCPNPRISKRIKSLNKISSRISVVYWNRFKEIKTLPPEINLGIKELNISCSREILKRIVENIKLFFIALIALYKEKPEILYIDGIDMLIIGTTYKFLHRSKKIIYEVSDIPGGRFKKYFIISWLINFLHKIYFRAVDLFVFTSPFFQEEYSRYLSRRQILIMENLPEKRIFKNFRPEKHQKLTIGFIGSVRYSQQLINLFEACKDLADRVQIIVAGEGPDYSYIKEVAKGYSNVAMTGLFDYETEIVSIYNKIDLVYGVYDASIFNVRKAIPNKLYEAIVCGLPIIVAKNTALAEKVNEYKAGFTVSEKNSEDTKKIIRQILLNPNILEIYRKNSKQIKENFYFEKLEEKFLEKILSILI